MCKLICKCQLIKLCHLQLIWSDVFVLFCVASCGIPFQVLPDYQEGAEQVGWTIRVNCSSEVDGSNEVGASRFDGSN